MGIVVGGPHGAGVGHSVAVREGLEVEPGLGGIHLLSEAQQVERGVGADFVFHSCCCIHFD